MKTFMFARKAIIEMWRSPQIFWLYLLFPSMMVLIYYFAFGQAAGMSNYVTVLVSNQDDGELGAGLVQAMREAKFDDYSAFTLMEGVTPGEAEILLNEGKAAILVTIPPRFSAALQNELPQPVEISLLGDPLSDTYAFAFSFLNETIQSYCDEITGWQQDLPVSLEFLPNTGTVNDFQIGVPGLIVFGIMFGIITNALLLTRETSDGTIRRIQMSAVNAGHFLGGISLAGVGLAWLQMLITLGTAAAVGYRPVGSLWLVIAIGIVCSLSAAGVGFVAASFSKTEGEATAYGTALMVPLVFFCGGIFPMPLVELFRIGSVVFQPYDILPSTVASQAMKKVILYGEGISGLPYELVMLILTSLALLLIGVRLYQSRVLNR